ncbi:hypothetical protein BDK51DRAFT_40627 [Blyttiomyces helicus]|uniref:CBS domain-containing protein n=1 Tax=Blyttiomyces helicus TaxID=388810 RepID=A0A4P9WAK4_9FUNG|nr:hypothetical protein BDK51DRAFT_40627 [Blyttiomyces helicus]|eukprot:RKO89629.1 hypothetical protein BDK51DRAFT_40627 [Blyttiomyces helicus]
MPTTSLLSLTFTELLANQTRPPLTVANPESTVASALLSLKKLDRLCLPLASHTGRKRVVAVVSTSDILAYIVRTSGVSGKGDGKLHPDRVDLTQPIDRVLPLESDEESYRFWERDYRDTIETTLIAFARGVHRALITDALDERPPALLTQTDVLRYVHANMSCVPPSVSLDAPISSILPSAARKLVTMAADESAISGLIRIRESKIAALPVVNTSGSVVANLSVSDLRGVTSVELYNLNSPVIEYLKSLSPNGNPKSLNPIVVTPQDSMRSVLNILVEKHIHRVWVVASADDRRPIGVVSQSDVIATFAGVSVP